MGQYDRPSHPQFVEDQGASRRWHIWDRQDDGKFLCVLCGGVTRVPSLDDLPDWGFRELTMRDRRLGRFIDVDKVK